MRQVGGTAFDEADGMDRSCIILTVYFRLLLRFNHWSFMVALRHNVIEILIQIFVVQDHSMRTENSGN
jgi:hypothetical protein